MSSKNLDRSYSLSITKDTNTSSSPSSSSTTTGINYNNLKDQIRKIGYLKKLGGKGISKNWKKRFFILTNSGILYYFKHRTSSEPVGTINLEEYTKIYKDKSKKKCYFLLVNENNPNQRIYHLIAETEEDLSSWISEITEFFEDDISDLKNQLSGIAKQKKEKRYYDTLKRNAIKSKKVEEYDLEKLQLVFKGERLSLLVKDTSQLLINKDNNNSNTTSSQNNNNNNNNSGNPVSPDSSNIDNSSENNNSNNSDSNNSSPTLISINNSTMTTTIPLDSNLNNLSSTISNTAAATTSLNGNNNLNVHSHQRNLSTSSTSPKTPRPEPPPRKDLHQSDQQQQIKNSNSIDNLTPIIDDDDDDDSEESN